MRVLICGGRTATRAVEDAIWRWISENCVSGDTVIHGAASGVDKVVGQAANARSGVAVWAFPADWAQYGRAAGPIRNAQMLREGKPDFVIAFPGGRGTANMIRQAEANGIPVHRIDVKEPPE